MQQITKAQLEKLLENNDSLQYMGTALIGGQTRMFYRVKVEVGIEPKGFKIIYIVV